MFICLVWTLEAISHSRMGLVWTGFLQSERTKQKIPCNCEALQFELETIGPCNCIYRLKWNKEMGSHALLLLAKAHFDIIDL